MQWIRSISKPEHHRFSISTASMIMPKMLIWSMCMAMNHRFVGMLRWIHTLSPNLTCILVGVLSQLSSFLVMRLKGRHEPIIKI